jgi:hypothetical protein
MVGKCTCIFLVVWLSVNVAHGNKYIFYLHNRFFEEAGVKGVHPQYGAADYNDLVKAFRQASFTVISELRKRNTDANTYAEKIVKQVDSLLQSGIKPGDITVIGASKGAYIAMRVSALLKNKQLNFVFIGICSDEIMADTSLLFYGNILSIYEKSDDLGQSCGKLRQLSTAGLGHYKEIALHTGLKHGFLYKPLDEWVKPSIRWANGQYK